MLIVEQSEIEKYVDIILELPIFDDFKKRDNIKKFFVENYYNLYKEHPEDIQFLFSKLNKMTPVSSAFAESFGILPEDVATVLNYVIFDIVKFYTYKGSEYNLKLLIDILGNHGLTVNIFKITVKDQFYYLGTNIITNDTQVFPNEFITHKHLMRLSDYTSIIEQDQYDTIELVMTYSFDTKFDSMTYNPPAALQAYAFNKFGSSTIEFSITSSKSYSSSIVNLFKIMKYIVFIILRSTDPTFEISGSLSTNWLFTVPDQSYQDTLYDLCETYFFNINGRRDMDEYIRREALTLNNYFVDVGDATIQDYKVMLDSIPEFNNPGEPTITEFLESLPISTLELALLYMRGDILHFINNYSYDNTKLPVDKLATTVFLYIININLNTANQGTIQEITRNTINTFAKYFLPIYTDISQYHKKIMKVKSRMFKMYMDDEVRKLLINSHPTSAVEFIDELNTTVQKNKDHTYIELGSSMVSQTLTGAEEPHISQERDDEWRLIIYDDAGNPRDVVYGTG
jgi:hypothetical protein